MRFLLVAAGCVAALAVLLSPAPATAETIGGNPGPQFNYVCPNSDGKPALDCYFDAVAHLYTMCKHVKSIEIIEFGYDHSTEGTNSSKSEYCLTKQKLNMTRPYQAALKSATVSKQAVEALRSLNDLWLKAMADLPWKTGESDEDYKARTMRPYEGFAERVVAVQTAIQVAALPTAQRAAHNKAPAVKPAVKTMAKAASVTKTAAKPAVPAKATN